MEAEFVLALLLAALAGWVDAAGLATSGDLFISFMSGNTTDLGVAVTHRDWVKAGTIVAILALFVLGVVVGELLEPLAGRRGMSFVLGIEACFLAACAALGSDGFIALYPAVFAMGLQNATMRRAGGISIGLTYVTGTLVQIGRAIAARDIGKLWRYLALWGSLGIGAGLAASVPAFYAMVAAAVFAASLAVVTARATS